MPRSSPLAGRSLTARLAVTSVALVALVSLLVVTVNALTLHRSLLERLDEDLHQAVGRAMAGPELDDQPPGRRGGGPRGGDRDVVQSPGTLLAVITGDEAQGLVFEGSGARRPLSEEAAEALRSLDGLEPRDPPRTVEIPGHGEYRVLAARSGAIDAIRGDEEEDGAEVGEDAEAAGVVAVGLPTDDVDAVVAGAVLREIGVALLAILLAGFVGVAVVRRQLAPLREVAATAHAVAEMPLSEGEVGVTARVPERLTDTRTEVGQVGAALNVLLGRVEGALGDRHRSEQQVRQFVADASHELRTPLATIQGYAELARRTEESGAPLQALGKVEGEATRMASLVEDLLLLARLDAGRPLAAEDVDLTMLVVETVADARVLSPDHHWRLRLPDDPVVVVGDEQRIRQVLTNLTSNARRHTPPGTTVTVSLEREAAQARITVADDGPGVPFELQPTIFERFTRADAARSREGAGVGLGLSLARAIARAHGGDVTLESRPGATAFTLTVPVEGEPEYL